MSVKCFSIMCGILILTAAGVVAGDSTPVSIEQLRERSDLIVRGRVESKTCAEDERGRIYTKVEFTPAGVWKGEIEERDTIEIFHSGGVLGDKMVVARGQVRFDPGEDAVVFLIKNREGRNIVVGMALGKFRISGQGVYDDAALTSVSKAAEDKRTCISPAMRIPLSSLKERVMGGEE
ncbi:MAG: hypothetical protein K9N52_03705 [Verrucomicrobia bacterium]|nr:hypothetical protein [Verrucomicrobiota bacterium]